MKALLSFVVLLVCLIFLACDGDDGMKPGPTPTPIVTPTPECIPNEELIDSECVAEDLFLACNRYFCEEVEEVGIIPPPGAPFGGECVAVDCETIVCEFEGYTDLDIMDVDGFPGLFGVFFTDVVDQEPIEFGPCGFE